MLPEVARRLAEEIVGEPVGAGRAIGGGDINEAAVVETAGGRVFLKWRARTPPGFFAAEADGLARLAATGTVRVPRVLGFRDGRSVAGLALEYVEPAARGREAMADGGRRLAMLHALGGLAPGLDRDNFIGSLPQSNGAPHDGRWLTFLRERRLDAMADGLPGRVRQRLEGLPLERILEEPVGGCVLLHGDLWAGNFLAGAGGRGWLIDPAVYAGHPEVDLAMTRLFGGFDPSFYDAYQEVAGRFDGGLGDRLALLTLYPLLVHVRLFGGGYLARVEAILKRFGAA